MSAAHTPGPWIPREQGDANEWCVLDADGQWLISFRQNGELMDAKQQANARVMAAAPELLEALTMVRDADEDCIRDHLQRMPSSARQLIDAAIAKATGGAA